MLEPTKSAPRAANTGATAQEIVAPMQASRYSDLIEKAIKAAQALKPNEALFIPFECVIARAPSGKLRFGTGWMDTTWRQGDPVALMRQALTTVLDWRTNGYYAGQYANDLKLLKPSPVIDVGKPTFRRDRAAMGLPA